MLGAADEVRQKTSADHNSRAANGAWRVERLNVIETGNIGARLADVHTLRPK